MSTVDYIKQFVEYFTMLIDVLKSFMAMLSGGDDATTDA